MWNRNRNGNVRDDEKKKHQQIEKLDIIVICGRDGSRGKERQIEKEREREWKSACKVAPLLGETLVLFHQNKYQYEHYKSIEQYIT